MLYCKDCVYFKKDTYSTFCTRMTKRTLLFGDCYEKVSPYGSCVHFTANATKKNSGYSENPSGCFLTSACVSYMKKDDDCIELTRLRKFRDTYLNETESGQALIKEYYEIAPRIVDEIEKSSQKDKIYNYIYSIIQKCLEQLNKNNFENAVIEYKTMVRHLQNTFDIS